MPGSRLAVRGFDYRIKPVVFLKRQEEGSGGGSSPSALSSFDLENTSVSSSTGFFKVGQAFEQGDVPSGDILTASIGGNPISVNMIGINTWPDGSLRKCTLVGNAGTVPGSGSVTIDLDKTTGTQSASGINPVTYLTANTDLNVQITNHTGDTSGALGDLSFSLNTALATASRIDTVADTENFVRLDVWEAISGDDHLICLYYVDLWLVSGSVVAVEWCPVMSQHWWIDDPLGNGVSNKEERNYDIAARDATTVLESETGVEHHYYARMPVLRSADDDQHAKKIWIDKGSAMPTLNLAYSLDTKKRFMQSGYLPPLKQGVTYDKTGLVDTYAPYDGSTATTQLNHRRAINGTGGYNGRGIISHMDGIALTEQSAEAWRIARVSAQAGHWVQFHIRDHRSNGTDVSNKIFPSRLEQQGAKTYTGLPAEIITVSGSGGDLNDSQVLGGSDSRGAFTNWDHAHHTVYGYFMAFAEGEKHLEDTVLSALDFLCHGTNINSYLSLNYNPFAVRPKLLWDTDADERPSAITNKFFGVSYLVMRQERDPAWCQISMDHAWCVLADNDIQKPVLENYLTNANQWIEESVDEFPAAQLNHGSMWTRNGPRAKAWMANLCALAFARSTLLHSTVTFPGFVEFRDISFKWTEGLLDNSRLYALEADEYMRHDGATAGFVDYHEPEDAYVYVNCTDISSDVLTFSSLRENLLPQDGDTLIPFNDLAEGDDAVPVDLTEFTVYFVRDFTKVNDTTFTCTVALTSGGAAITLTDTTTRAVFGLKRTIDTQAVQGTGSTYIGEADSFLSIGNAAIEYMHGLGDSSVDDTEIAASRTFYAPQDFTSSPAFSSWNFDGDLIK